MADLQKLSVELAPDLAADLHAAVDDGDYGSVGEVVRDALRDWQRRRQNEILEVDDLHRLVQEGIDSGPGIEGAEVFARLRTKFGQPPTG